MGNAGAQLNSAYQRDGRRVQDLGAHRVHNFQLAGQAHVGDEGTQRPPLQARQRLRFGGRDGRLDAPLGLLAHVSTQVPQVVYILRVDGQLVGGRGLCRAFRMGPARLCPRTRPHDVVGVGPREIRREGHVEGQVDLRARRDHGRGARSGRGALYRRGDGHVVVRPREREAGRGRHFFPPVPCLAGEVGYLVHSVSTTRAPDGSTGGGAGGRKGEEARRDAACASGARAARRPAFWDLEVTTSDQSSTAVVQTQTRARTATPEAARLAEPPNGLRTAHSRFSRRRPGGCCCCCPDWPALVGICSKPKRHSAPSGEAHTASYEQTTRISRPRLTVAAACAACAACAANLLSRPARRLYPHRFPSSCRFTSHRCLMQSGRGF
jgi:hypothetical protein